MARAKTFGWIGLAIGLAGLIGLGTGAGTWVRAQARPSRAHMYLKNATESYLRGDYEVADTFFQQAEAGQDDLTAAERQDLASARKRNSDALTAQQQGADKVRQAEAALEANNIQEASGLLRDLAANQFLTPADKVKTMQLQAKIRPALPAQPAPKAAGSSTVVQARIKLQQARSFMARGNLSAAEQLAREADGLGAVYTPGEDTPRKLLDEISRAHATARQDPKTLLANARAALERKDYDAAEKWALEAEKAGSRWSIGLFADSPAKVLRDLETARTRQAQDGTRPAETRPSVAQGPTTLPPVKSQPGQPAESPSGPTSTDKPASVPPAVKPAIEPTAAAPVSPETVARPTAKLPPAVSSGPATGAGSGAAAGATAKAASPSTGAASKVINPNETAIQMIAQGRIALARNDLDKARRMAREAANLRPNLRWWDDTPDKLLADVQRAEAARKPAPAVASADSKSKTGETRPAQPPAAPLRNWPTPTVARPDADKVEQARAETPGELPPPVWPDMDDKQPEAGPVQQAVARETNPAEASKPAGPRPHPIQQATAKERIAAMMETGKSMPAANKTDPARPDAADPARPVARSDESTEAARLLLKQGRAALEVGDFARARQLADQASNLKPNLDWSEDTPSKLRADIGRFEQRNAAAQAPAGKPAAEGPMPSNPKALLRHGRDFYQSGNYDRAKEVAYKIKKDHPEAKWGLFDDSPDRLLQDVQKAQARRDQEESVKLLADARKLLEQGDLDEAARKAYRAERLHGPYSIWDLGDRPGKVLAEVETRRAKLHKPKLPPPVGGAVAAVTDRKPDPKPAVPGASNQVASGPKPPTPPVRPPAVNPVRPPAPPVGPPAVQQLPPPVADVAQPHVAPSMDNPVQPPASPTQPPMETVAGANPPAGDNVQAGFRTETLPAPTGPIEETRAEAQQMLAEARKLQKEGRLIEARWQALAAQRAGVAFGPDEDRPERALLELAWLCEKRIENLVQEAIDLASTGDQDPARFQKAEQNLADARSLGAGFGLDVQPIELRLAWVKERKAGTASPAVASGPAAVPPSPPQPPAVPPAPPEAPPAVASTVPPTGPVATVQHQEQTQQQRGLALLDKARLELRRGQTVTARRIAEEVYSGKYGVEEEASQVLRSIDVEEHNQTILAANQKFEAGHAAFLAKKYAEARTLFESIDDLRLLQPDRRSKLKEVMQTAEMQPGAGSRTPLAPVGVPGPLGDKVAGARPAAQVVDVHRPVNAADDYARQVQAMQEIKFQMLREEGLKAQREATDAFQRGDTSRALDLLQEYARSLESTDLDPAKATLLRRPVDNRLQTLRTLKAQREFETNQRSQKDSFNVIKSREAVAEADTQKQVQALVKQYHDLFKQGKYRDAEMLAMKAHELDPDNATVDACIQIARTNARQVAATNVKSSREETFWRVMTDAEDYDNTPDDKNPLIVDPEASAFARNRVDYSQGILTRIPSAKEKAIERRLSEPINLNFYNMPLKQVIDDLREQTGINVVPDIQALEDDGVSLERPVTLPHLDGVSLKSALNILLRQVRLTYIIKDEVLMITTTKGAQGKQKQKIWPVADLIIPVDNYIVPPSAQLMKVMGQGAPTLNLNGSPAQSPFPLAGGQPVGGNPVQMQSTTLAGSMAGTSQGTAQPNAPASTRAPGQTQTMEELLINLITNTIAPDSWSTVGGTGTIDYFPLGMALVINQTADVQEQIGALLDALRRLQDVEVAVEVRMISLEEAFFERIGVDFNINIKTNKHTKAYEPQLVTQQFAPPGYINDFSPSGGFISGLTPAGNFTSDLDIPIRNSSFNMAIPPFGGFPNIPGADGGLSMGLAFLSDIQVFMFMEAAQGDRRTNVMQAPKLTLFNGQTSTIQIQDFQFFVTNVQVAQVGGQVVFIPQNTPMPLGVNLAVQAVVSGDRRFVRLNIAPTMTNLASATVPLFPITTFITPVFEGGAQGQPIPFTQFIQQPTFTLVTIQTSVSVPDGGTVLLGGLKLLNEGRNEFGPPLLSKMPYINRLFKNVGYGRDTSSLLLMVTPRVIINLEQEEIQTQVVTPPFEGI